MKKGKVIYLATTVMNLKNITKAQNKFKARPLFYISLRTSIKYGLLKRSSNNRYDIMRTIEGMYELNRYANIDFKERSLA